MRSVSRRARATVGGFLLVAAVMPASVGAAPDSLTISREEAVERALAGVGDMARFQSAIRAAEALARVPALVSNPVIEVETEGARSPFSGRDYTRRITLEQEIDLAGQGKARRRVGQATVTVAERELAARQQIIQSAVDEAYGRWLIAQRRRVFLAPLAERARELSRHAEESRRREIVTGFDVRVLRGDVAELESEGATAQSELEQAEAELRIWLGLPSATSLRLADDLDGRPWRCPSDSLTQRARSSRTDLARAAAAESLAERRVFLERRLARGNPTLGISAGQERRSFDSPSVGTLDDRATTVGIRATVPIPLVRASFGVNEAQLELARSQNERAVLELAVRQDVAAACAGLTAAEDRLSMLRDAVTSAPSDLRLTESAYREGRIPLDQYLTVRERLVRIQREALDAEAALEEARTRLVRATGLRRDALTSILETTER